MKHLMFESCPRCGGRVSHEHEESGAIDAICIGVAGEERSCGWATVIPAPVVKQPA